MPLRANDVPQNAALGSASHFAAFFAHPTTYLAPVVGIAPTRPGGEFQARVDGAVMRLQANARRVLCAIDNTCVRGLNRYVLRF